MKIINKRRLKGAAAAKLIKRFVENARDSQLHDDTLNSLELIAQHLEEPKKR